MAQTNNGKLCLAILIETFKINYRYAMLVQCHGFLLPIYYTGVMYKNGYNQGRRQKIFGGFPKWCKQNSRAGSGEHSSQTLKGISHFCTTFVEFFYYVIVK